MALFTSGVFPAGGEAGNGGGVIQQKYYAYKDVRAISTGGSFTLITYWDATITPTDATNKIKITAFLDWAGGDSFESPAIVRVTASGSQEVAIRQLLHA